MAGARGPLYHMVRSGGSGEKGEAEGVSTEPRLVPGPAGPRAGWQKHGVQANAQGQSWWGSRSVGSKARAGRMARPGPVPGARSSGAPGGSAGAWGSGWHVVLELPVGRQGEAAAAGSGRTNYIYLHEVRWGNGFRLVQFRLMLVFFRTN